MWTFAPREDSPQLLTAKIKFMPIDALKKKSARSISSIQTLTATEGTALPTCMISEAGRRSPVRRMYG